MTQAMIGTVTAFLLLLSGGNSAEGIDPANNGTETSGGLKSPGQVWALQEASARTAFLTSWSGALQVG